MGTGILLALFLALPAGSGSVSTAPVAVIDSLAGEAAVVPPAGERRPLYLFDRLRAGARLEAGPEARIGLAFANGRRYELGAGARATLGPVDLASRSGAVRRLPDVPPLPRLDALAAEDGPGWRAGAVRIRGEGLSDLYPREGMAPEQAAAVPGRDGIRGELERAEALLGEGDAARLREDFPAAEALYRRAKEILEVRQPWSLEMAKVLKKLALLTAARNDFESTDLSLQRALAIEEELDSSGEGLAATLNNLGLQHYGQRNFAKALEYLHRSVQLREKLAPDSLMLAKGLQNLGAVRIEAGDCAAGGEACRRSLDIRQRRGAPALEIARSLQGLGAHALQCGDLAAAEAFHRQALAIYETADPGGNGHFETLFNLGSVARRQGRRSAAVEHLCHAADRFEARWDTANGIGWREDRYFPYCAMAQAEAGNPADAFFYLERGRARTLLEEIAEREGRGADSLPEEARRRKMEIDRELESIQGALARLEGPEDSAESRRLFDRLREVRDRQLALALRLRRGGLPPAAVRHPEPLDLADARRALDPGTVLLAYLVAEEKTFLFAVHPSASPGPGVAVFSLPVGGKALAEKVEALRELSRRDDSGLEDFRSRAADLYALLLAPAETEIAAARRILILPDGPLYRLPFAALVRQGRYLAEWKPLHSVASASVYAELKETRRATDLARSEVVAFGDPVYPRLARDRGTLPAETLEILTAVRRGLSLDPLPATRAEVEAIAELFPHARLYLGAEATEERAKSLPAGTRIVHFASHGLLDERFPLHSALALTMPGEPRAGQENGLLQAWEVIESVRLDADLVTLSACDTALGKDAFAEELNGLTRAFLYAGARSVLSSLWSVADASTADFMKRFYGHLRAGKAKDEALQAAQVEMIRSSGSSHPFRWAAFQLSGDWR